MIRHQYLSLYFFTLLVGLLSACKSMYVPMQAQYSNQRITKELATDSVLYYTIKSYGDSVDKSMNAVIGTVQQTLEKDQPEGTLGNFMADAYLTMGALQFEKSIDAAFVNYGGIRLQQLPAGALTLGKIFELMPFDNVLVLQQLSGVQLQSFLDLVAARGGWPVAGIRFTIKDKKAIEVFIKDKPLQPEATYWILNSDFVASGGDNAEMLKVLPQLSNGYLARRALIDYVSWQVRKQGFVGASLEKRVVYAQ
ncbi:MAG: 5'-nucleotidase C-terminal domain-containing protein [Sphingomonadales bacterium]